MKRTLSAAVLGAAMACMISAGTARAEGLLGKNYAGGSLGVVQFGEDYMDDMFGKGTGLNGFGNLNLHPNLDLHLGVGYHWADGDYRGVEVDMSSLGAGADLVWFFKPNQRLNPYLRAGLALVKDEIEADAFGLTVSKDDTEVGFGGGAGAEYEASREVLLRAGLDYLNLDSEDSFSLSGSFGYWFNRKMLGFVGAGYDFESEDKTGEVGMVFKL